MYIAMARITLYEYTAKKLLLGDDYNGMAVVAGTSCPLLPKGQYAVKVDQGVKKRGKRGLVRLNVRAEEVNEAVTELARCGYGHFLIEKMVPHEQTEERYISITRERHGMTILVSSRGGSAVEETKSLVSSILWKDGEPAPYFDAVPPHFIDGLREKMNRYHISFLELNPFIIRMNEIVILDCAMKVDDAASYAVAGAWSFSDVPPPKDLTPAEDVVQKIDETTPASLKLNVLNENGSLFLLLSSGGASIVLADDAYVRGLGNQIANYGEYSGAPTRTETYLYSREVLGLLRRSCSKKKALVIAGGVANFTDIKETFSGILDALDEVRDDLRSLGVKVFVRRGGPNETKGLSMMEAFLSKNGILGSVYGSETLLTQPIRDATAFLKTQ